MIQRNAEPFLDEAVMALFDLYPNLKKSGVEIIFCRDLLNKTLQKKDWWVGLDRMERVWAVKGSINRLMRNRSKIVDVKNPDGTSQKEKVQISKKLECVAMRGKEKIRFYAPIDPKKPVKPSKVRDYYIDI